MSCLIWLACRQFFNLFLCILFFIQLSHHLHATLLCPQDQSFALLQFKNAFFFNKSAFFGYCGETSYPKLLSWKEGTDCCSWDGVECDKESSGHVIGLDLSCSWLYGTIHPNTTLFLLSPHLQKLNLAFNDFNLSPIPAAFSRFTSLTLLNLSGSEFSGEISSKISFLSKLTSLDLSWNDNLRLKNPGFQLLVQNLTNLRELHLDLVNLSSVVPNSLLNLTSLTSLTLVRCGLQGKFPNDIFHLPNLKKLVLWLNDELTGHLPKFNSSSPLQYLDLERTGFSGQLPNSIDNLKSLNTLYVTNCKFSGAIPASLGKLTQITILFLGGNNFSDPLIPLVSNLSQLVWLSLSSTQIAGPLPSQVSALPNLKGLFLDNCLISGTIQSWVFTLPSLLSLNLSQNKFIGYINEFQSNSLYFINLSKNKLQGTIPSSIFQLVNLTTLDLSSNNLSGTIEQFSSKYIRYLNLHSNSFQGTLPIPPSTALVFSISNNKFIGDIPPLICNASMLEILNFSNNSLSGAIPECLGNFSKALFILDLSTNSFRGAIPNTFIRGNILRTLDLNGNELKGPIPKSLVNCKELEMLDLGNNKLSDTFPRWLKDLPKLHVLILQSNRFHGPIITSKTNFSFPNLRVIDISYNNFSGPLPTKYFESFEAMRNVDEIEFKLEYMVADNHYGQYYENSITLAMKGSKFEMKKILTIFTAIDFSKNKFDGEIPFVIGNLNSIRGLNLSHNNFKGQIPTSFENLSKLEWLDLSSNMLTGMIPQQLTSLTSLGGFNVSYNQLTGPIPQGNQFNTYQNDSYVGNFGLCGFPLSKKCNNFEEAAKFQEKDEELESLSEFDWKVILMGYGCGLVFGVSMGYIMFTTGKPKWLVRTIEDKIHKNKRRSRKHARRN